MEFILRVVDLTWKFSLRALSSLFYLFSSLSFTTYTDLLPLFCNLPRLGLPVLVSYLPSFMHTLTNPRHQPFHPLLRNTINQRNCMTSDTQLEAKSLYIMKEAKRSSLASSAYLHMSPAHALSIPYRCTSFLLPISACIFEYL